jgi:hypothetical protein
MKAMIPALAALELEAGPAFALASSSIFNRHFQEGCYNGYVCYVPCSGISSMDANSGVSSTDANRSHELRIL